jgi:hypothetical protein
MDAIGLVLDKNIAKYSEGIIKKAFGIYKTCFSLQSSFSLSQMRLLLDTLDEVFEKEKIKYNYGLLTDEIEERLKKMEEKDAKKDENKKRGWATLIKNRTVVKHLIETIATIGDAKCFKDFINDVYSETDDPNRQDIISYMAKVRFLKAIFFSLLTMFRIERTGQDFEVFKTRYLLTNKEGVLQCLIQKVQ